MGDFKISTGPGRVDICDLESFNFFWMLATSSVCVLFAQAQD